MQIKVTLDQEIYEYLKTNSQQNRRTLSAELNTILEQYIKGAGISSTPVNYPNTTHSPIPETPYKITAKAPAKVNTIEDEEELINDPYYDPNF